MLSIQYLSATDRERSVWGDNQGRVFLDLGAFEARLTKALDRSDIQQITQEASLSGSIPATRKNRALLEKYRPDVLNRETGPMLIETTQYGKRINLDAAIITGFSESEKSFDFEPFAQSYLDELELVKLSDVDLGTFEWTKANIISTWGDRESIVQAGFCDYGAWNTPGQVEIQDFRIWFRLVSLMKKVACHIGWNFTSPHWENGDGKHLMGYLSDKYWHFYSTKTGDRYVQLNIASPRVLAAAVSFPTFDTVFDPNNLYDNISLAPNAYWYGGFVDYEKVRVIIRVTDLTVTLPAPPIGEPAYTYVFGITRTNGGAEYSFAHREFITGSVDQQVKKKISFQYIDYEATGDETYEFFMFYQNISILTGGYSTYTLESCDIDIIVDDLRYVEGDTIPLGELLSSEVTGRTLLEGMAGLCNGKIFTNYDSKEIVMYSPYDYYTLDGTTKIQGFFLPGSPIDLRSKTITDETEWEDDSKETERFLIYRFASSDDQFLESDEIFSKRVDLGAGTNKEKAIENPLFQATGEITVEAANVGGTGDIRMPALWDNTDFQLSSEVGYRVCNYYGYVNQNANTWNFNGVNENLIPYLAMIPSFTLPSGIDFIPVTYNGFDRDIYMLHYQKEVEACRAGIVYSLLIDGGDEVYDLITFRKNILIQGEDSALELTPITVKDHPYGQRVPLLIEARPV